MKECQVFSFCRFNLMKIMVGFSKIIASYGFGSDELMNSIMVVVSEAEWNRRSDPVACTFCTGNCHATAHITSRGKHIYYGWNHKTKWDSPWCLSTLAIEDQRISFHGAQRIWYTRNLQWMDSARSASRVFVCACVYATSFFLPNKRRTSCGFYPKRIFMSNRQMRNIKARLTSTNVLRILTCPQPTEWTNDG